MEKIYLELNKEEDVVLKKFYNSLKTKELLLFTLILIGATFSRLNTNKSILDFLSFIHFGDLLICGVIFKNYLLSIDKEWINSL